MPTSKPEKPDQGEAKEPTSAFLKPLQPSEELAAIVGSDPLPRPEVMSRDWDYIKKHKPDVVAIERPLLKPTKRGALVTVVAQELRAHSRELGVRVVTIPVKGVRKSVTGNEWAKKVEVAKKLATQFPELASLVPVPPKRAALGLRSRDRYWLHLFDALAVATATSGGVQPPLADTRSAFGSS